MAAGKPTSTPSPRSHTRRAGWRQPRTGRHRPCQTSSSWDAAPLSVAASYDEQGAPRNPRGSATELQETAGGCGLRGADYRHAGGGRRGGGGQEKECISIAAGPPATEMAKRSERVKKILDLCVHTYGTWYTPEYCIYFTFFCALFFVTPL